MGESKIKRGHIVGGNHYEITKEGIKKYTGWGVPKWAKEIEGNILYRELWSGGDKITGESDYIFELEIFPPKFERIK